MPHHLELRQMTTDILSMPVQMGSITDNGSGGTYPYRASKAAMNAGLKMCPGLNQISNVYNRLQNKLAAGVDHVRVACLS